MMIYDRLSSSIKYEPGTRLSSVSNSTIVGISTVDYWILGSEFTIPKEGLSKVILRDKIGSTIIERVFGRIGNAKEVFPISIKLYESNESRILLMKNGIGSLLYELSNSIKSKIFLNDIITQQILSEMSSADPVYASEAYDEICLNGYRLHGQINNESVGIVDDSKRNSIRDMGKKDDDIHIETNKSIMSEWADGYGVEDGEGNIILTPKDLIEDIIAPSLTTRYENEAYDKFTLLSAWNQTLDKCEMRNFNNYCKYRELKEFNKLKGVIPLTDFNSTTLTLANYIHAIPYFEFACVINTRQRTITWFNKVSDNELADINDKDFVNCLINQILYRDVNKIYISKNQYDELLIEFDTSNVRVKYFVDLTVVSILSRSLAHTYS